MKIRMLVIVLLAISCVALVLPAIAKYSSIPNNLRLVFDALLGPSTARPTKIQPDDPGSGGGGTGVIN